MQIRRWAAPELQDILEAPTFTKPFDVYDLAARVSLAVEQMIGGRVAVCR